jgi:hypothetical protein
MSKTSGLALLMLVVGLLFIDLANAADLDARGPYRHRYRRVASLEQVSYTSSDCRVGWWQTLRSGHVRPRWGAICR